MSKVKRKKRPCKFGLISIFGTVAIFATVTGCTATKSVITEYDAGGKVTKVTETSESVVSSVIESTKGKTVIMYDNSFLAYLSASASTVEDPTPTIKCGIGKADRGLLTITDSAKIDVPRAIEAMRAGEITLSASGIGSQSGVDSEKK